ncbi:MAG: Asp-tRNA(Asn)/Glu-tRNA(Gln) amidotransferase subunit GatC [Candidatus Pacebacteria bacterium]|nr:Asp-tRNA(Asn)/Glu-tRNA(Gln) amidotransferase subunit GatC [Candidatus Paceibacterota bacterium]
MKSDNITTDVIKHLAHLASLNITDDQVKTFQSQLNSILEYMSKIQQLNTDNVEETTNVNGLTNVFREDIIDESRMFSQDEALKNAIRIYHGYFVVDAILE